MTPLVYVHMGRITQYTRPREVFGKYADQADHADLLYVIIGESLIGMVCRMPISRSAYLVFSGRMAVTSGAAPMRGSALLTFVVVDQQVLVW